MTLNERKLEAACKQVVLATLWQSPNPRCLDDIITSEQRDSTLSAYVDVAKDQARYLPKYDEDPNVVTRAVRYLAHEHAIPPMKDNVEWFRDSLEVLIRLVLPNAEATPEAAAFMHDLRRGIERYRADLN